MPLAGARRADPDPGRCAPGSGQNEESGSFRNSISSGVEGRPSASLRWGKAAEPVDDHLVPQRVVEAVLVAQGGEECHGARLLGRIFAVLEREIQELSFPPRTSSGRSPARVLPSPDRAPPHPTRTRADRPGRGGAGTDRGRLTAARRPRADTRQRSGTPSLRSASWRSRKHSRMRASTASPPWNHSSGPNSRTRGRAPRRCAMTRIRDEVNRCAPRHPNYPGRGNPISSSTLRRTAFRPPFRSGVRRPSPRAT